MMIGEPIARANLSTVLKILAALHLVVLQQDISQFGEVAVAITTLLSSKPQSCGDILEEQDTEDCGGGGQTPFGIARHEDL
jgi:hypothetical protein